MKTPSFVMVKEINVKHKLIKTKAFRAYAMLGKINWVVGILSSSQLQHPPTKLG